MDKPICILDTTSIVVFTHLIIKDFILGNMRIKDALTNYFKFIVPDYVIDEEISGAIRNHTETYDVEVPLNFRENYEKIDLAEYNACLNVVRKWINLKQIYIKEGKDEGEIRCMALSIYLSRKTNGDIFVVTDDKRARRKMLDDFIESQKIGHSMSFPDLLLYLFSRNYLIKKTHVEKIFREYYQIMPARDADEIKKTYEMWLRMSCKVVGTENRLCTLNCT